MQNYAIFATILLLHDAYAMHRADCAVARCLSCPSVCLAHAGIPLTPLNISSEFFYCPLAHYSSFSIPYGMAIFQRQPLDGGVECKGV